MFRYYYDDEDDDAVKPEPVSGKPASECQILVTRKLDLHLWGI